MLCLPSPGLTSENQIGYIAIQLRFCSVRKGQSSSTVLCSSWFYGPSLGTLSPSVMWFPKPCNSYLKKKQDFKMLARDSSRQLSSLCDSLKFVTTHNSFTHKKKWQIKYALSQDINGRRRRKKVKSSLQMAHDHLMAHLKT